MTSKKAYAMIRTPAELDQSLKSTVNRQAVFFAHVLVAATIAIHTWANPASTTLQRAFMVAIAIMIVLLGILRTFDFTTINHHPTRYLIAYHAALFIGIVFMADYATPYVLLWLPIIFLANLYYGQKGVWWSVNIFGIATIGKLIFAMSNNADTAEILNVIAAWFIVVAVCSFYISIQKIYDLDRSKLKKTLAKARQQEQRLQALINNMTESVLVLDGAYSVTLYNAAALGLLDTNENITNKQLDQVAHLEDGKTQAITSMNLLKDLSQAITRRDLYLVYGENDRAALSTTITPIRTAFGEDMQDGYIVTMRDITREKSLEEERDEFISVITHELRTPVSITEANVSNAILVHERGDDEEKVTKSLTNAHDQVVYLASMLNDLTTFARAEQGNLKFTAEPINISNLFESLVAAYHKQAEQKGLTLTSTIDPSVPNDFASSSLYVREVLQNFIVNATKYSDSGTITISAAGLEDGRVRFSVTDQGHGISTSDQQKVFDKFFRSEDYHTRSTGGSGLGLYIVRKLSDVLHAKIELESELGKGSTFSIIVPNLPIEPKK